MVPTVVTPYPDVLVFRPVVACMTLVLTACTCIDAYIIHVVVVCNNQLCVSMSYGPLISRFHYTLSAAAAAGHAPLGQL
jgi:hypothetical protein